MAGLNNEDKAYDYEQLRTQCERFTNEVASLKRQQSEVTKKGSEVATTIGDGDTHRQSFIGGSQPKPLSHFGGEQPGHKLRNSDASTDKKTYEFDMMDEQQKASRCCDTEHCDILPPPVTVHQLQQQPESDFSIARMSSMSSRSGSSSDVLNRMYDTAVDRYETLKREHNKLRQLYDDLLCTMNEESERSSKKYGAKCQELCEVKEEMASLRLQCTAAIHKWNSIIIQNGELSDTIEKLTQKYEELTKETSRLASAKDDEIIALQNEKEEQMAEQKLLLSERDTVLKEIDQLHDKLNDSVKKIQGVEAEKRKLQDQVISLHEEIASAMQDRDRALKDANDLRQRYGNVVCEKEEAKQEISAFRTHLDVLTQERNAARQERLEAIKNYERILQETYEIKEKAEGKELASKEAEGLRRDIEVLRRELADAREEAVVAKMRRDWAFSERDKIVLERESVRRQCDELRRERDRAVSSHADVLRELDDLKKYKLDVMKQLKDMRCKDQAEGQERKSCFNSPVTVEGAAQNSSRDSAIDADMQDCDAETLEVELDGDKLNNLDIDVCCTRSDGTGDMPVYITSFAKGASCDGKLRINDILLRVNDVDLTQEGIRKEVVQETLRAACAASAAGMNQAPVRILIRRRRQQRSHVTLHVNRKDAGIQIEQGLYVSKIDNSLAAARDGLIAAGDRLLYVNHKSVENKSVKEVMKLIDNCRDYLTLTVGKCRHAGADASGSPAGNTSAGSSSPYPYAHKAQASAPPNGYPLYAENVQSSKKHKQDSRGEQKVVSAFFDKLFGSRHHKHNAHQRGGVQSSAGEGSEQSDDDEDTIKLPRGSAQPLVLDSLEAVFGHGSGAGCPDGSDTWPKYRQPVASSTSAVLDGTPPHGTLTARAPRKERPGIPAEWFAGSPTYVQSRETETPYNDTERQRFPGGSQSATGSAGMGAPQALAPSDPARNDVQRSHSRTGSQVEAMGPGRYSSLPSSARANPVPFDKLDKSKSLDSRRQQRPESMHLTVAPSLSLSAFGPLGSGSGSLSFQTGYSVPGLASVTAEGSDVLSSEFNKNVLKLKQQAGRPPGQGRGRAKRETPPGHAPTGRSRELQKPPSLNLHFVSPPHAISPISFEHGRYGDCRPPSSPFAKAVPSPTLNQCFAPVGSTVAFPSVPSSPIRKTSGTSPMSSVLFQMMSHHGAPHQVTAPVYTSPPPYRDCLRHPSLSELENGQMAPRRHVSASSYYSAFPASSVQNNTSAVSSRATTPHGGGGGIVGNGIAAGDGDLYHANYRPATASMEPDGFFTYPKRKNQPERINLSSCQQVASKSSINKISNGSIDNISPSERSGTPVVAADSHRHSSCSLGGIVSRTGDSRGNSATRRPPKPKVGDIRTIEVDKSTEPLGFQIEESPGRGIFVSSVSQNSLAAEAGIEVGDQLLDVCGINMRGASYEQASRVLRQFGDMTIKMLLQFNPNRCHAHELDLSASSSTSSSSTGNSPTSAIMPVVQQSPVASRQVKNAETALSLYAVANSSVSSSLSTVRHSFRSSMHSRESSGAPDDSHSLSSELSRHVCLKWTPSGATATSAASSYPLGICLVGGNATGVFVNEVVPGSPAAAAGVLRQGDQVLEVNNMDLRAATGERVLLELQRAASAGGGSPNSSDAFQQTSGGQQQLVLLVHNNMAKWNRARERRGIGADLFYVRALSSHDATIGSSAEDDVCELSFEIGELLLIDSTLHDGRLGRWHAWRVDEMDTRLQAGTIPSRLREALQDTDDHPQSAVSPQRGHNSGITPSRRSFLRRRRHQRNSEYGTAGSSKDSRELVCSDLSMSTDSVPGIDECIPAIYQRVEKRESSILRPVILLGPFSDALVEKLTSESPDKYEHCDMEMMKTLGSAVDKGIADGIFIDYRKRDDLYEVVRKTTVLDVASRNHHCMLLVGPAAVERLQRVGIYPIVLYTKHKSAKQLREVKDPKFLPERLSSKSAKEMFERFQKVEVDFKSHFSAVIPGSSMAAMCQCIKQAIDNEQKKKIWLAVN